MATPTISVNFITVRTVRFALSMICVFVSFQASRTALSQDAVDKAGKGLDSRPNPIPVGLRYDDPRPYPLGTKDSAIVADFKCGPDGTVFLPIIDNVAALNNEANHSGSDVGRMGRILITALTPSGSVVRFAHEDLPGLRNLVPEIRYFVSDSRVYTLEVARTYDPSDPRIDTGQVQLVFVYDFQGGYRGMIRLPSGTTPVNIAAFPSGDIMIVSLDKLNQTTRLMVFDQAGRKVTELRLFDDDYAHLLSLRDNEDDKDVNGVSKSLWNQLATAHWVVHGENLLMSPENARLPLVEINEHGVVRTTDVALPAGAMVDGAFSSEDGIYHVLAGDSAEPIPPGGANDAGRGQRALFMPTEIDDINPADGTIVQRVEFAKGLMPACVGGGSYTFVSPRKEDGRLQTIHGHLSH